MKKKKIFVPYNFNLDSIINPKLNEQKKLKKNLIISPIPISINKNKLKKTINNQKKESLSNKLFFNLQINKPNKGYINDYSLREKSKEENSTESLKGNDYNNLKKNLEVIKIEIQMRNKMIKDNKINIEKLMKNLEELNIMKINKEKILEDNLSKKETLEEMCKNVIKNIKNSNYLNNENYYVEISSEEIKANNLDSFINKVYKVFNHINTSIDVNHYNFIYSLIKNSYTNFYSNLANNKSPNTDIIINNFFHNISSPISTSILSKIPYKYINLLLHFLLKVNVVSESINEIINFLEKEYKKQKNDIKDRIEKSEIKIKAIQAKKDELVELKNKINGKIEMFSQKKSPFCEKVVYEKKLNKKELKLSNISPTIQFSTKGFNKSNSSSISKYKMLSNSSNKKENNDFTQRKKLIYRNMMKILNKKCNTEEYNTYHSNKISKAKICINKISSNCSAQKIKKVQGKRGLKNKNKKIYIIPPNNKSKQNGSNMGIRERNKINLKIKELSKFHNFTEYECITNPNLIRVNKTKITKNNDKDNGRKEYNKIIKTERDIEDMGNITQITVNTKDNESFMNDNFKNIYINENYNLSKVFSLYDNISFEKKKSPNNTNNGKNLFKYLTKKDYYKYVNGSNDKNIHYQKIRNDSNNLITNRMKSKNKNLNKEMTERKKNKYIYNSYNTFENLDKSEIRTNKKVREKINNNNTLESFCYYKYIDKYSKLFNPLINNINLNKLGYSEGFISIDTDLNCIKIDSNNIMPNNINHSYYISNYENSNNYSKSEKISYGYKLNVINIKLKDITKVYMNKLMKNIVKIHNIFLKYNISNKNDKENINKKFININKLINVREILNIKDMEQSEKIKAGLCNFFSFIIEFGNNNILECILINFFQFNTWFNYLDDFANNNIKMKKNISNGNSSGNKNKNNGIFKLKSLYSKIKGKQIDKIQRSITEKKKKSD